MKAMFPWTSFSERVLGTGLHIGRNDEEKWQANSQLQQKVIKNSVKKKKKNSVQKWTEKRKFRQIVPGCSLQKELLRERKGIMNLIVPQSHPTVWYSYAEVLKPNISKCDYYLEIEPLRRQLRGKKEVMWVGPNPPRLIPL